MDYMKNSWHDIFQSLRIALDVRKLFLGFAILATIGIGVVLYFGFLMYQVVDDYNNLEQEKNTRFGISRTNVDELGFKERGLFTILWDGDGFAIKNAYLLAIEDMGFTQYTEIHTYALDENLISSTSKDIQYPKMETSKERLFANHVARGFTFWRVFILIILGLVIWYFISRWFGAISRIAIVEFAKDERIEMGEALEFAKKNAKPFFWAPISLFLFFAFLFFAIALWGLVGSIPVAGPIIAILTSPLVLIAGFLMALLVFGGFFSMNLYAPAIATEATDSFDSLSRSFSYFFSKPFHFLWYVLVAMVYGIICIGFVWIITSLILCLISWAAGFGMGENWEFFKAFITLGQYQSNSVGLTDIADKAGFFPALFSFFMGIIAVMIAGMAISYTVAFKATANAIIYLLLRNKVDGTDMTDISYEEIDFINALEDSAKEKEDTTDEKQADDSDKDSAEEEKQADDSDKDSAEKEKPSDDEKKDETE